MSEGHKDFQIKLNLNVDDVKVAAELARAEMAKTENEAKRIAIEVEKLEHQKSEAALREARRLKAEQDKLNGRHLTDTEVHERAKAQIIQRANEERIKSEVQAHEQSKRGFLESTGAANAFAGALTNIAAQYVGFQALTGFVGGVKAAFEQANEKARDFARQVIDTRDALREMASIAGVKADASFTAENAAFDVETGFRPTESNEFRKQLMGSGAQFKGANISDKEFAEFEKQAGKITVASGIEPGVMGKLSGSLLGFSNFNKFGDNASEQAAGGLNRAMKILQRGKGENPVLVRQLEMLASASVNEDELRGIFRNPDEAAIAISVGAEKHDAQASELTRAAARGLFSTKDKAQGLLQGAGITSKDKDFFTRLQKLSAFYEKEGAAKGVPLNEFLGGAFEDELTREGLSVFMNRGVKGGVIADRRAEAAKYTAENAQAEADAFLQSPETSGPFRIGEAKRRQAELIRGQATAGIQGVQQEAIANLTRRKQLDTTQSNLSDLFSNMMDPFGAILGVGAKQNRINMEMGDILRRRAKMAGVASSRTDQLQYDTQEGVNSYLSNLANRIESARPGASNSDDVARGVTETNRILRQSAGRPLPVQPRGGNPSLAR